MVFFVCEGCNETLKKNQVDKHANSCRNCYAVTCVDCSVTFYENDYAAHITCISEAEKYEKSLYKAKPGANKPKAQDIWTALIEDIVSETNQAPPSVRPFLSRLATLNNVPRIKKKFINFSRNSLNIRSDAILEDMWNFLDKVREQKETVTAAETPAPSSSSSSKKAAAVAVEEATPSQLPVETFAEDSERKDKKSKKDKKRKNDETTSNDTTEDVIQAKKAKVEDTIAQEEETTPKEKKSKKDKKDKKDKKESK